MRVASLVSGGKDSIFASYVAHQSGWEVSAYVTLLPEAEAPMLFHRPNAAWAKLQAKAARVAWRAVNLGAQDDEEAALERALSGLRVDGVTSGALASEYQRTRFESVCHRLGLKTFAPLWHHDPARHLRDLEAAGIRSVFTHVSASGLGAEWLGEPLEGANIPVLEELGRRHRIHVAGEGGEYETFVTDAPHFASRIVIDKAHTEIARDTATYVIESARLEAKTSLRP
ncbi:MAG: diphthine--ammonia ligase [Euryarchaeota archaeon]|nr:diphthine--ammonia ligase [Euryarchaeota archaeon]